MPALSEVSYSTSGYTSLETYIHLLQVSALP